MNSDTKARTSDIQERIRDLAYQLWISEGRPDGRDQEHWEEARRIVEQQVGPAAEALSDVPRSQSVDVTAIQSAKAAAPIKKKTRKSAKSRPE